MLIGFLLFNTHTLMPVTLTAQGDGAGVSPLAPEHPLPAKLYEQEQTRDLSHRENGVISVINLCEKMV